VNFRDLTYRQKNLLLLVSAFIFLLIVWQAAIKKTLGIRSDVNELANTMVIQNDASGQMPQLNKKLETINGYLRKYTSDSIRDQQFVMSRLSELCHRFNVTLKNFPQPFSTRENSLSLDTNIIETEGSFANLLKLVHALETDANIGRIASARFLTTVDPRTRKTVLTLTIYLQNIKTINDGQKI
jgi:hypothetical protein